ncbi:MAG TPA: hypothetical protein VKR61_14365 [Bryobacteraceae bacterium]|nr:hypothetical protein [Bryobacteraceae bacterium]
MLQYIKQAKSALSLLSPEEVRRRAERPVVVGLVAGGSPAYADMEDFLAPSAVSHDKRMQLMQTVYRACDPGIPDKYDLVLYEQGLPTPATAFTFFRDDPMRTVEEILEAREDLGLALARNFHPFRKPVVDHVIASVARENAIFAVASALPNVVPSFLELPWAIGEFASDTAFITMNQVRMAFLVAAASDKKVGYNEQLAELVSIAAGAFGWRALARELVGFIPLGGGLIPKGAIAFAATYVLGKGLEHFHGVGYGYTRTQRRDAYQLAYERGKDLVSSVLRKKEP